MGLRVRGLGLRVRRGESERKDGKAKGGWGGR